MGADMTKERLELSQDLLPERERARNLEETVRLLKEQAEIYQLQMEELQAGGASNSKSFQHFKTQIDKLTKSMGQLEKDTANWRQKYEVGDYTTAWSSTIFFSSIGDESEKEAGDNGEAEQDFEPRADHTLGEMQSIGDLERGEGSSS